MPPVMLSMLGSVLTVDAVLFRRRAGMPLRQTWPALNLVTHSHPAACCPCGAEPEPAGSTPEEKSGCVDLEDTCQLLIPPKAGCRYHECATEEYLLLHVVRDDECYCCPSAGCC